MYLNKYNIIVTAVPVDRRGRDRMILDLQLPMQLVSITTDVVSSNIDQGEVHNLM